MELMQKKNQNNRTSRDLYIEGKEICIKRQNQKPSKDTETDITADRE